ncbi:1110051M20Rik [Phodopus roborovskii]|uniref:Centriolar satellite-associated tubulin polyglutamylase complex regulator 1 n=1 Tax=Phodopus roborovskii TaxID=109678 RepID=A0AAU9Z7P8_PHORO|nr:1110051M20Rik [Phodopus roborovskii]
MFAASSRQAWPKHETLSRHSAKYCKDSISSDFNPEKRHSVGKHPPPPSTAAPHSRCDSEQLLIVLMDDAMDCLMSFSDFLFAFQIQFYYSEFLDSVAAIYQDLLSGKNPNTVIVPTSSSGQHRQRPALGDAGMLDGVEASLFYQRLENLCDRHKYSCPPPALVREILSNVQRLTFYGFLVALSKHHGINQALGALPDKGDLMHDPAMDEELERLVVRSRLYRTPRQHRGKEPGAFDFQRRDKLEALERVPSALAPTPNPFRWEPRE